MSKKVAECPDWLLKKLNNQEITDYKIISDSGNQCEERVAYMISQGYEPYGELNITEDDGELLYTQAIVSRNKD